MATTIKSMFEVRLEQLFVKFYGTTTGELDKQAYYGEYCYMLELAELYAKGKVRNGEIKSRI